MHLRKLEAGIQQRCFYPILGFTDGGFRQPHHGHTGKPAAKVYFHGDFRCRNSNACPAVNQRKTHPTSVVRYIVALMMLVSAGKDSRKEPEIYVRNSIALLLYYSGWRSAGLELIQAFFQVPEFLPGAR